MPDGIDDALVAGTYTYQQGWAGERQRLSGLEEIWDPGSRRALTALGLQAGWRCLEVGAGSGSIARWLAHFVGQHGEVVATDLDPRFLAGATERNLHVVQHDIAADPPPDGQFDLVHARLVLAHLPDRAAVLDTLVRSCAPGGWLLIEEFDWPRRVADDGPHLTGPDRLLAIYTRVNEAINDLMRANGYDAEYGRYLPLRLGQSGLEELGVLQHGGLIRGAEVAAEFDRQAILQLRDQLRSAADLTSEELDAVLSALGDPQFVVPSPTMIAARGRRPSSTAQRPRWCRG